MPAIFGEIQQRRRQVTKRTFNLLGSPLKNVQPDKTRGSSQKGNISKSKQNGMVNTLSDDKQSKSNRGKGNKSKADSSSPAELLKEQKENEASIDPNIDCTDSDKNEDEIDHTPQKQQKLDVEGYSPADVSTSFLASTPKPGKPQLSRRRPMTPVREALVRPQVEENIVTLQNSRKVDITGNHSFKQKKVNDLEEIEDRQQIKRDSPLKRSPFKQAFSKRSPHKHYDSSHKRSAGSSIDEKIASIVKSRLEKKRNNSGFSKNSVNDIEVKIGKSKAESMNVSEQRSNLVRTKSKAKQPKMSVSVVENVSASISSLRQRGSNTSDKDILDLPETETSIRDRSSKLTRNSKSQVTSEASFTDRRETRGNLSRTRLGNNVNSSENDVTVKDTTSRGRGSLASAQRKSTVNRKLQSLSRNMQVASTSADDTSSAVDQTMMVWETDSQKRNRSDLVDLDVVLSTVTETLEARMDVYDTDEEQSVVRLLEKYLTSDITHMIHGVQTVTGLQTKIRRTGQSIKQKQKSLMALQKERIEREEKCEPLKKLVKENENLTTINQFLKDLSTMIDKC